MKPKSDKKQKIIPFVIPFNQHNPPIRKIIETYTHVLAASPETTLLQSQMVLAFSRPKSLRDIIIRSDIIATKIIKGSSPCGKPCRICNYMSPCTTYASLSTKNTYSINMEINCQSTYVIYLIQCKKCGKQYVGQTSNTLNTRIRNHLYDIIRGDDTKPVAKHFSSNNHNSNDVTVIGISLAPRDVNKRLRLEDSWIDIMKTRSPWGMNLIS